jgi:hypothetical protein
MTEKTELKKLYTIKLRRGHLETHSERFCFDLTMTIRKNLQYKIGLHVELSLSCTAF